jgi:glycosyltransferase involved in cell wall biosynthesis
MTPKVSILIANHDYVAFVGEAIASALAQTHPSTEVIVVDDGSTDGSRAVIEGFAGITAIFQENAGHAAAARAGLDRATGDIVIFLDADDRLRPEAAATVAALWRDGVRAVQFRLELFGEVEQPGETLPHYVFEHGDVGAYFADTGSLTYPPTSGNAYAIEFARRVFSLSQGLTHSGFDGWLCFSAALTGELVSIDTVLGDYRIHSANMSRPGRRRSLGSIKRDLYFVYHAQQSAFRVARSYGVAVTPPPHLIGPYYLTWWFLLRDAPATRWDIPPVPRWSGLVTGLANFRRLTSIGRIHRSAAMLAFVVVVLAPKSVRRLLARYRYRYVDDLGF